MAFLSKGPYRVYKIVLSQYFSFSLAWPVSLSPGRSSLLFPRAPWKYIILLLSGWCFGEKRKIKRRLKDLSQTRVWNRCSRDKKHLPRVTVTSVRPEIQTRYALENYPYTQVLIVIRWLLLCTGCVSLCPLAAELAGYFSGKGHVKGRSTAKPASSCIGRVSVLKKPKTNNKEMKINIYTN